MEPKLYLVGMGLDPVNHATIEVLQALGRCDVVYGHGLDKDAVDYLNRFTSSTVKPAPEDAATILKDCAAGRVVGVATPAHPALWSNLGPELARLAKDKGIVTKVFGAVSAAGVALAATGKALGDDVLGLQAFDADALSAGRVRLNPAIPLVVYSCPPSSGSYRALAAALLSKYPGEHPVRWCGDAGVEKTATLKDLATDTTPMTLKTVLFLEAAQTSSSSWDEQLETRRRGKVKSGGG